MAEPSNQLGVYHSYLASSYHTGIISGFSLISSYMENMVAGGKIVSTAISDNCLTDVKFVNLSL